jgi:hypothetical protein
MFGIVMVSVVLVCNALAPAKAKIIMHELGQFATMAKISAEK